MYILSLPFCLKYMYGKAYNTPIQQMNVVQPFLRVIHCSVFNWQMQYLPCPLKAFLFTTSRLSGPDIYCSLAVGIPALLFSDFAVIYRLLLLHVHELVLIYSLSFSCPSPPLPPSLPPSLLPSFPLSFVFLWRSSA